VEIGCGNGHFLAEYGSSHPGSACLGVEIKTKRCLKASLKIEKFGLANAWILRATAEQVLGRLPDGAVARFHIYFPDPWPKSRHRRRRFLRWENLQELARTLSPGGELRFATDFFDYYLQGKLLCLLHPALALAPARLSESIFRSVYGKFFADKGRRVYSFIAQRRT
jgi:tRNA (guanine-N(7)-)-methyltransferase